MTQAYDVSQYMRKLENHAHLLCIHCKFCITPTKRGIKEHVNTTAHSSMKRTLKAKLVRDGVNLHAVSSEYVTNPLPYDPPIHGLEIHPGWKCTTKVRKENGKLESCDKLCTTELSMEKHSAADHGWVKSKPKQWEKCSIQTFFPNNRAKYFIVHDLRRLNNEETNGESTDPTDQLFEEALNEASRRDIVTRIERNKVNDTDILVDKGPWLRRTKWSRTFKGLDMSVLNGFSQINNDDDATKIICEGVERVLRRCVEGIHDCGDRNWDVIMFWLASAHSDKPESQPFNYYSTDETVSRYLGIWQRFLCFCVQAYDERDSFRLSFTPKQEEYLEKLRLKAQSDCDDEEETDRLITNLSVEFITSSSTKSALLYFAGVLGWREDSGQWRRPENYTPLLAGFQFCMRVIILEHALPQDERSNYSLNEPLEIFKRFHEQWLVEGVLTPFDYIHRLLNYGMAAAKNSGGRDRVRWSADRKVLYFDGRMLELQAWKQFILDLMEDAEKILSKKLPTIR
jgi:Orsellinic acid/F9775 biosynthesis cluster protein D